MRSLLPLLAALASGPHVLAGDVIAVRAGTLVDVESGQARANQILLVESGRITAVGAGLAIPEGATVIDLSGSTVLPGLVDAHTHLCARTRIEADRLGLDVLDMVLLDPPGYRALQGAAHARQMLEAGFTTVRDLGNAGAYVDVDVQRAIAEGLLVGPTMVVAGRIITPFGGQFRARVEKKVLENSEYFFADTRDELRKAVRENAFYGSNVIKLIPDSRKYSYSAADLRFVVEEAREAGLEVAVHCQTAACERRAAEAAPASIEHAWRLEDPETIALIRKNGVVLVTTDFTEPVLRAFGWDEANARRIHAARVARLKKAYEAGLTIAFGSDVMVDVPGETRGTLAAGYVDSFVEAGVAAADILRIFTLNGARLLGLEKERGRLAPGAAADLVATAANPLEDARALKAIHFVMKDGRVVRRDRP
jgi:imidazolonepropionase-like amidohydrolase